MISLWCVTVQCAYTGEGNSHQQVPDPVWVKRQEESPEAVGKCPPRNVVSRMEQRPISGIMPSASTAIRAERN